MAMERVILPGCFRDSSVSSNLLWCRRAAAEELKRQADRVERESRLRQEAEAVRQQLEDQRLREQRAHKAELSALRDQVGFPRSPVSNILKPDLVLGPSNSCPMGWVTRARYVLYPLRCRAA